MSEIDDKITSLLSENRDFDPPKQGRDTAWIKDMAEYESIYQRSMNDLEGYWADRAEELVDWYSPWDTVLNAD